MPTCPFIITPGEADGCHAAFGFLPCGGLVEVVECGAGRLALLEVGGAGLAAGASGACGAGIAGGVAVAGLI